MMNRRVDGDVCAVRQQRIVTSLRRAVLAACVVAVSGCGSIDLKPVKDRAVAQLTGPLSGYFSTEGLAWHDKIFSAGLISGTARSGELASIDIWPLGGFGIGLSGIRARILALEGALGTGLSPPQMPPAPKKPDDTTTTPAAETGSR